MLKTRTSQLPFGPDILRFYEASYIRSCVHTCEHRKGADPLSPGPILARSMAEGDVVCVTSAMAPKASYTSLHSLSLDILEYNVSMRAQEMAH